MTPRRSPRLNSKFKDEEKIQKVTVASGKKRRKITETESEPMIPAWKRPGKARGKLRRLPEMPLDILFETFGYLSTPDVLNLARATKALRSILITRSTKSLWKQALLNCEPQPPECPSDLNEIQYANLLFSSHCHFCSRPNVMDAAWFYRVRCCSECYPKQCVQWSQHGRIRYPNVLPISTICLKKNRGSAPFVPQNELAKYPNPEAVRCPNIEEARFIDIKLKHAGSCRVWLANLRRARELEIDEMLKKREADIFAKLISLGWQDEMNRLGLGTLSAHPLVKQSKELTARIWNNISPELVGLLDEHKQDRLRRERVIVFSQRMQVLAPHVRLNTAEVDPGPADVCAFKEARAIISSPLQATITLESFAGVLKRLPQLSIQWRQANLQLLGQLIPRAKDLSALELATTFFRCHWCRDPISYPRVLEHHCLTDYRDRSINDEFLDACIVLHKQPWNYNNEQIEFDEEAFDYAKRIVVACGQDPNTVSASEMDELDLRIECLHPDCGGTSKKGKLVMRWTTALDHDLKFHVVEPGSTKIWWRVVDEVIAEAAKELEAKAMAKRQDCLKDFSCTVCGSYINEKEIKDHFKQHDLKKLGIKAKNVKDHVRHHHDAPFSRPPFAVRVKGTETSR